MPDLELLEDTRKKRGITVTALCQNAGILRETYYNRLSGIGEFTIPEMEGIKKALFLDLLTFLSIFFPEEVEK